MRKHIVFLTVSIVLSSPAVSHEFSSDILEWWPISEFGLKTNTDIDGDFRDECEFMGRAVESHLASISKGSKPVISADSDNYLKHIIEPYFYLCWPENNDPKPK